MNSNLSILFGCKGVKMHIKLYLDVFFLVNFIVDTAVLLLVNLILRLRVKTRRIILGGFAGAFTLCIFALFGFFYNPVKSTLIYIGISLEAHLICFGCRKGFLTKWLLSTTIMILIGSGMTYIKNLFQIGIFDLCKWFLCFMGIFTICMLLIKKLKGEIEKSKSIYIVKLLVNQKMVVEHLYYDTGNLLYDSLFQKPVIVLSEKCVRECFGVEECRVLDEYFKMGILDYSYLHSEKLQKKYCFHEVFYESVGKQNGKMLCFLADEVEIIGENKKFLKQPVAVASSKLFDGKIYQGLLQRDCIE